MPFRGQLKSYQLRAGNKSGGANPLFLRIRSVPRPVFLGDGPLPSEAEDQIDSGAESRCPAGVVPRRNKPVQAFEILFWDANRYLL